MRREEASAWRALGFWLAGWLEVSHAPARERTEAARRLQAVLFNGRKFSRGRYEEAWAEADARLTTMQEKKFKAAIETLGAEHFFDRIRETHRASGEWLGTTKAKEFAERAASPTVKPLIAELRDAMREYVVKVTAYGLTDASSRTLAERLLAPIG